MAYDFDWDGTTLTLGDDEAQTFVLPTEPTGNQQGVDAPGPLSALTDFINLGVFNGNFRLGPPDPSLNIDVASSTSGSNFMQGWRFVQSSNTNITAKQVRDTNSPSGSNLRFTFASGSANDEAYIEQVIDLGGSRNQIIADLMFLSGVLVSGSGLALRGKFQYLDVGGGLVGMPAEVTSGNAGTGSTATGAGAFPSGSQVPPGNARYLRSRIIAFRASGTGAGSVDLIDVRRFRGQSVYVLPDQDPTFRPGQIYQDGGTAWVEQFNTSVPMPLGHQLVPVTFVQNNIAAGTTANMDMSSSGSPALLKMPWSGSIVGASYRMDGTLSAGTLAVRATVNGSNVWTAHSLTSASPQTDYTSQPLGTDAFIPGDTVGVELSSNGGFLPTTRDIIVTLWLAITYDGL